MNDNLYYWQNELMITTKMEEFRHEIDDIRLLREAGQTNPGWIERVLIAVGSFLARYGKSLRDNNTDPHQTYQMTSGKLAS